MLRHSQIFESFTYGEQLCTEMSHLSRVRERETAATCNHAVSVEPAQVQGAPPPSGDP